MTDTPGRQQTEIDRIAERYLDSAIALSPLMATYLGADTRPGEVDDLTIEGHAARAEADRRALADLEAATPIDDVDRVTVAAMRERLELAGEQWQRVLGGVDSLHLNVVTSAAQELRDVFDIMPKEGEDAWGDIAARLRAVPVALRQFAGSLNYSAERGAVAPRRQVAKVADQCADQAGDDTTYAALLSQAAAQGLPDSLQQDLAAAVAGACSAYGELEGYLRGTLLAQAPESDAAGTERYALESRSYLGATVDLAETYAWGQEEVARIDAMMRETAGAIRPGATVHEAIEILDADPAYQLHGTDALREWMQVKADEAVTALADAHFDIPDPVRTIECLIAPSQTGGIYYTSPSEDFSRPGRMWWSVPKGVTEFTSWRELTTVYHEGVPGHHLQIGQTVYRSELLNRWRRLASWTSGHGEGWALYAEWLMADLGFMDDPGNRMGLLDGQALRAARVVLDIGVHCGFEAPAEVGGGAWTYDKAWQFLTAHTHGEESFTRFELDRYLGWPGQAPSYKVGERLWLQLRDEVRQAEGADFDLKAFHRRALDIGSVGLDTLHSAVLGRL